MYWLSGNATCFIIVYFSKWSTLFSKASCLTAIERISTLISLTLLAIDIKALTPKAPTNPNIPKSIVII